MEQVILKLLSARYGELKLELEGYRVPTQRGELCVQFRDDTVVMLYSYEIWSQVWDVIYSYQYDDPKLLTHISLFIDEKWLKLDNNEF